jgi:hypothetical protein
MNLKNKLFLAVFSAVFVFFISQNVIAQDDSYEGEAEMTQESKAEDVLVKKVGIQQEQAVSDDEDGEDEVGEESIGEDSEEVGEED